MAANPINPEQQTSAGPQPVELRPVQSLNRLNRLQAMAEITIALLVVLTAFYVAKLILVVLLVSILLAYVLAPLVDLLERARFPRSIASLVAVVVLLAAVGVIGYTSYSKATDFLHELPRYSGRIRSLAGKMRKGTESIQRATEQVAGQNPQRRQQPPQVPNWSSMATENLGSVTEVILMASFIPFLVYFMLSWQAHARASTVKLFHLENRNTAYVTIGQISAMIRGYIVGNVLVGLFLGGISTVIFGLLGVPYFYFVGFISGFLSLVPYLGLIIAAVPPLLAGAGQIHSTGAVVIVVTVVALHLLALNVLYPKFLGGRLQLNPLAGSLALVFWGWLWGAMGLVLAIPVTAALKIICDHVASLHAYGEWLGE